MNYEHQYHAGNFADVMKHILLLQLLEKLNGKDKPYSYVDTHGGAGIYDLSQAAAQKTGEFLTGIHRLVSLDAREKKQAPESIQYYLNLVEDIRKQQSKGIYPGSPWFALQQLREFDKAHIFEYKEEVFHQLRHNIRDRRASLHHRDAYEGLLALIPVKEKRGLVMIDPPYEMERKDFPELVELLQKAYKKWPTGIFALWYPIKDRAMIERFEKKMIKTGIHRQLVCELCVWSDDTAIGLNGSGLLIINPPWQFAEQAEQALKWLLPHLRMQEGAGKANVRWLVGE